MKTIYITLTFQFIVLFAWSQNNDHNFISGTIPTTNITDINQLSSSNSNTVIQYFDGLGRLRETIQKTITPLGSDLATYTEYDGYGREIIQWLPVNVSGNNGSFVNYSTFTAKNATVYNSDNNPYSTMKYESSPLGRVTEQYGAGDLWYNNQKNIKSGFETNQANDVLFFYVSNNILYKSDSYDKATLMVTKVTDEDGNVSYLFKNKFGQDILKRSINSGNNDTYYVYNDYGQLSFVLPPNFIQEIGSATSFNENSDLIKKYAYVYKYDEVGNCIYKRLPGCEPIFMVYDKANRLIISQDGNQRSSIPVSWTVNKYDGLGRLVFTALLYRDISQSEKDMIHTNIVTGSDDETNALNFNGTTTTFFQNELIFLTLNYYDNYSFLDRLTTTEKTNLNYVSPGSADYGNRYTDSNGNVNAKGLLTGTRVYILDNVISSYLATATYYDEKGQVVQSRSTNHLSGYDFTYNGYNFAGQILKTKHTHSSATRSAIDEITTNEYDNTGRLKTVKYKIGGYTDDVILSSYTYDELGRVVGNMRHTGTDSELFEYNIRNWSTKITSGTFVEKILYNKDLPSQATARYNGNIAFSSVISGGGRALGYTYTYDNLNRLRLATGYSVSPSTGALTAYGYNEEFNYDKQGNINFLQRKTSTTLMDYLGFTYNGNQITAITDYTGSINVYDIKEYNNNNTSGYDFAYDNNGNMLVDKDRKIVAIRYNLLNLPDIIQFSNGNQIKNRYAADGRKLGTEYYTQLVALNQPLTEGTILNQTYQANVVDQKGNAYIGNFEYSTIWNVPLYTTLRKVFNSEGYVDEFNNNQTYSGFVYYRQDHLGNNCEVWRAGKAGGTAAATLQRTRYYPSGLPWNYTTGYAPTAQQYKYNGKEFIEMHGLDEYDSEARHYYPTIGRTTTIDPLAEKYYSISPYAWCGNNPLKYIDPDGKAIFNVDGGVKLTGQDAITAFLALKQLSAASKGFNINNFHLVYQSRTPEIYKHTLNSFRMGKPEILHYDADQQRRSERRAIAMKESGLSTAPGVERDEYPYASTFEGGHGANVIYVPRSENRSQGGSLGMLYSNMKTGDPFLVVPVPEEMEQDPVSQPVTVPQRNPLQQPYGVGSTISDGVTLGVVAYGMWQFVKWGVAIMAAPETGGGSLVGASLVP